MKRKAALSGPWHRLYLTIRAIVGIAWGGLAVLVVFAIHDVAVTTRTEKMIEHCATQALRNGYTDAPEAVCMAELEAKQGNPGKIWLDVPAKLRIHVSILTAYIVLGLILLLLPVVLELLYRWLVWIVSGKI